MYVMNSDYGLAIGHIRFEKVMYGVNESAADFILH